MFSYQMLLLTMIRMDVKMPQMKILIIIMIVSLMKTMIAKLEILIVHQTIQQTMMMMDVKILLLKMQMMIMMVLLIV